MGKALAFTGHRPESLPFGENEMDERCIKLKALLLDEITGRAAAGYDTFYCGVARGADIIFGRQVLLVKMTSYHCIKSYQGSQKRPISRQGDNRSFSYALSVLN